MSSDDVGEHYASAGRVFDGMAALAALTAVAGSLGLLRASFISPTATAVFAVVFLIAGRLMHHDSHTLARTPARVVARRMRRARTRP